MSESATETTPPRPGGARRWEWAECLSPALAAVCILATYFLFVGLFVNCARGGCAKPAIECYLRDHGACAASTTLTTEQAARLWAGRFLWVFVAAVGFLSNLLAVGVSIYVVWQSRAGRWYGGAYPPDRDARRAARRWIAGLLLLFAAITCGYFLVTPENFMSQMYELLKCTAAADLPRVVCVTHLLNFVGLGASACVVAASCELIRPTDVRARGLTDALERERAALALAGRLALLRALLYAGTAALVLGVLRINAQSRWVLAYLDPSSDADKAGAAVSSAMGSLISSLTSAQGASNTLFLAAVYVPAFLALRRRALALAGEDQPQEERDKWLKKYGLSFSFSDHLPRVVAILGPLIAGPLGDLIGRLSK